MTKRTCALEECERPYRANGYCDMHAQRLRHNGYPRLTKTPMLNAPAEERFMSHVRKTETCWLWNDGTNAGGYGHFWENRRGTPAHRWSYAHFNGPLDDSDIVRHTCDNPPCVNPAHLLSGTQKQNRGDAMERNRIPLGEEHHKAILTEDLVRYIRTTSETAASLARLFGVSKPTVQRARNRQTWKHVA
jgi:hypothetical protein